MEIIRRGLILPEEEAVANKLKELPDTWWCIGGDSNRFSFKRGEGTQIDFIVIAPKGIFLIDSKNIHTIELSGGNSIKFFNSQGKQIRKSTKRDNPVDEIIDERYKAKDWLKARGIEDFLTKDKRDLKTYLHGLVVIANENSVKYKNCKLEDINYHQHKYPTLLSLSELNKNFFDAINLPPNCNLLSQEEMWTLFKILYNPDLTISQILNEAKKEEDKLFQEKHIFIEKLRLLEDENIHLNKKANELEETRNNLITLNQKLTNSSDSYNEKLQALTKESEAVNNEKEKLKKEFNILVALNEQSEKKIQNQSTDLQSVNNRAEEVDREIYLLTTENKKLKQKQEKLSSQSLPKQLLTYKLISSILGILFFGSVLYSFLYNSDQISGIKTQLIHNTDKTFSNIEYIYPTIEKLYNDKKYKDLINLWHNAVLREKDFKSKKFHQYDELFFYIAQSYSQSKSYDNAIQYYNIFTEIAKAPEQKVKGTLNRSLSYIKQKKFVEAIFDLDEALILNRKYFKKNNYKKYYRWQIDILLNLGVVYNYISTEVSETEKNKYRKSLHSLNIDDFAKESLKYLKKGRDLATNSYHRANFEYEMGRLYSFRKEYKSALKQFLSATLSLEDPDLKPNSEINTKKMLAYNDVGATSSSLRKYGLAEKYYLKALKISQDKNLQIEENKKKIYESKFSLNIGSMFLRRKNYKKACLHLTNAYKIAEELKLPNLDLYKKRLDEVKKHTSNCS